MRRGFTLAEVLMATMVIAVAVLGLLSVQAYTFRAQTKTSERTLASVVAASRLNAIEAKLQEDFNLPVAAARAQVPDHPELQLAVVEAPVPSLTSLKDVSVSIYWTDANGDQEYALHTRVLKP